ncbi:hypothetical protein GCM10009838_14950 [Catenulispora subtropica]|uniref:Uncharacterized protein n=1 Tax=Catenulispora subtropica TaxID=450798 RepID=A0ABP5C945_9ACTN
MLLVHEPTPPVGLTYRLSVVVTVTADACVAAMPVIGTAKAVTQAARTAKRLILTSDIVPSLCGRFPPRRTTGAGHCGTRSSTKTSCMRELAKPCERPTDTEASEEQPSQS